MIAARSTASLPPMRRRALTLVSLPAPPASGSSTRETLELLDCDVLEDGEDDVVIELSQRREPSAPPPSGVRPAIMIDSGDVASACTAWEAAGLAAASLAKGLGARAVVIHSHDPATTELRVIGVEGPKASALLGAVDSSADDFIASTVFANGGVLAMLLSGELPRIAPRRLAFLDAAVSIVAVPIVSSARFVGLIEVIDVEESIVGRVAEACAEIRESLARLF